MARDGVVALVSGGVDSLLLIQTLLREGAVVHPLYVRCGFLWESAELFWLRRWLATIRHPRLNTLKIGELPLRSLYGHHWSLTGRGVPGRDSRDQAVYLPGRNVLLLSHAAIYASQHNVSTLALGTLAGNPFGDATPEFFTQLAACLRQALAHPIRVRAPLRRRTKADLVSASPSAPFQLTFSCIRPRGRRHCRRCNKCAERQRAFHHAGIPDPTDYARP